MVDKKTTMTKLRLAVIGAGVAGLTAARHGVCYGCDVTVFEQTSKLGGTWVYSDVIGKDKYGLDVHSSMYQGLKTNIPKEVMCYPDFPFTDQDASFLPSNEILEYLNSYADKFDIRKLINFEHHVVRVLPQRDGTWEIIVRNLPLDKYEIRYFDAVLVCNGHYTEPFIPKMEGSDIFEGKQLHSHDYRNSEKYESKSSIPSNENIYCNFLQAKGCW